MPLKYSTIIKILKDFDFVLVRTKWSHFRYTKNWYWVTISFHKEYPPKTAKSMLHEISNILWIEYKKLESEYNIKL